MLIAGGADGQRLSAAKDILKTHFSDDPVAAEKIDADIFEDLIYIDVEEGKTEITIGRIEYLIDVLSQKPFASTGKAAIIMDGECMNAAAQNKLLKILEEPSEGDVIVILAANPVRLLPTIRSRCVTRWLGYPQSSHCEGTAAEDILEIARILLFGKAALPEAFAILSTYENESAEQFLGALRMFLRDLATGAKTSSLIPEYSLASQEAAQGLSARRQRIVRNAVESVTRAIMEIENGGKAKYALRDMALCLKMEAKHA
jgi:hypothetical protein